jgi:hypothetical protein
LKPHPSPPWQCGTRPARHPVPRAATIRRLWARAGSRCRWAGSRAVGSELRVAESGRAAPWPGNRGIPHTVATTVCQRSARDSCVQRHGGRIGTPSLPERNSANRPTDPKPCSSRWPGHRNGEINRPSVMALTRSTRPCTARCDAGHGRWPPVGSDGPAPTGKPASAPRRSRSAPPAGLGLICCRLKALPAGTGRVLRGQAGRTARAASASHPLPSAPRRYQGPPDGGQGAAGKRVAGPAGSAGEADAEVAPPGRAALPGCGARRDRAVSRVVPRFGLARAVAGPRRTHAPSPPQGGRDWSISFAGRPAERGRVGGRIRAGRRGEGPPAGRRQRICRQGGLEAGRFRGDWCAERDAVCVRV